MRPSRLLLQRIRNAPTDLTAVITEAVNQAVEAKFDHTPTSGYTVTTERSHPKRDWHRPTIGFSPNGW